MSKLSSSSPVEFSWISEDEETRSFIQTCKILNLTAQHITQAKQKGTLFITLTYAQSIDGSIAAVKGIAC